MKGQTTDGACRLIKVNKREDWAKTRKSSNPASFLFRLMWLFFSILRRAKSFILKSESQGVRPDRVVDEIVWEIFL
jgi:hypothetical protein